MCPLACASSETCLPSRAEIVVGDTARRSLFVLRARKPVVTLKCGDEVD